MFCLSPASAHGVSSASSVVYKVHLVHGVCCAWCVLCMVCVVHGVCCAWCVWAWCVVVEDTNLRGNETEADRVGSDMHEKKKKSKEKRVEGEMYVRKCESEKDGKQNR